MFDREQFMDYLLGDQLSDSLANMDYIISILNTKAAVLASEADTPENVAKMNLITDILMEIKLVMRPALNNELH